MAVDGEYKTGKEGRSRGKKPSLRRKQIRPFSVSQVKGIKIKRVTKGKD
jgi:hypothetical protein